MSGKDYIKGKKSYTKWDVDKDNVDMDVDGEENLDFDNPGNGDIKIINNSSRSWFIGSKGKLLKSLICMAIFALGLLCGYLVSKGVHGYIYSYENSSSRLAIGYNEEFGDLLQDFVDSNRIMKNIEFLNAWRHRVFSEEQSSYRRALELQKVFKDYGLDSVELDKFNVLLSYPSNEKSNEVKLIDENNKEKYNANSPTIPVNVELDGHAKVWPYILYSPNGTFEGSFLYGHYGRHEDYEVLKSLGIDTKDKIVILRNGKTHIANKVKLAEKYGLKGILLYPDPQDYIGKDMSHLLKRRLNLPSDAIIIGNAKSIPGDPETPNVPSTSDSYRLPPEDIPLPRIPIQPISHSNAFHIMSYLDGPIADEWKGEIKDLNYHIGPKQKSPSNLKVRMIMRNEMKRGNIYNVIATIRGKVEPNKYIIIGDQLGTFSSKGIHSGPSDSVFLEVVRSFAALLQKGWQPRKTIIFAAFDAQEFGNVGLEEWLQAHESEIMTKTVAYLGVGRISGAHSLAVQSSPLLKQSIFASAKEVPSNDHDDPNHKIFESWRLNRPSSNSKSEPRMDPPGTADDFLDPMYMSGIPAAQFNFVGNSSDKYPYYYTKSYTFDVVQTIADPFVMATMAKVIALSALRLSDSLKLPMSATDYANQMRADLDTFLESYGDILQPPNIDSSSNLVEAMDHFVESSKTFDASFSLDENDEFLLKLQDHNDKLINLEKAFLVNPLFGNIVKHENVDTQLVRNLIYGPDPDNYGSAVAFPRLKSAINRAKLVNTSENWNIVQEELSLLCHSIHNAIGILSDSVMLNHAESSHNHH